MSRPTWRVKPGAIPWSEGMLVLGGGRAVQGSERWLKVCPGRPGGALALLVRAIADDDRPDPADPATAYLCIEWAANLDVERLPSWVHRLSRARLRQPDPRRHPAPLVIWRGWLRGRLLRGPDAIESALRILGVVEDVQ